MARADLINSSATYESKLLAVADRTPFIAEKMLLAGSAILADEVSRRLHAMFPDARYQLPSAMGITPVGHDNAGNYNIKIGFGGYQQYVVRENGGVYWPRKPAAYQLIARVIENGRKNGPFEIKARPFMSPAVRQTKSAVADAMQKAAEKAIEDIQKGI